ncbi:MAG: DUF1295 domain-containing protein [Gammaproteobacteria bacterium]|nr:DUF1295 domain-containing protein [Gammaproteobacteria bacterium]
MNIITQSFGVLIPMLIMGTAFWIISLIKKDVSVVDSLWSLFFIIAGVAVINDLPVISDRAMLVLLLVTIWGLRLSAYITLRHWGHEEDHRYQTIRKNNQPGFAFKSLYMIFVFQALVAWVVALPLFYAMNSTAPLTLLDGLAVLLWLVGMFFEIVSDYQLYQFKKKPDNKGKILTQGLWKYSRHPNYFGEFLVWWGFFVFALSNDGYISIISPLLMTFLLLKFSGVSLLEKTMKARPGYEVYMKNTNAFIPGTANKQGEL